MRQARGTGQVFYSNSYPYPWGRAWRPLGAYYNYAQEPPPRRPCCPCTAPFVAAVRFNGYRAAPAAAAQLPTACFETLDQPLEDLALDTYQ